MAAETDAARDRVLAARAGLGGELETLEASVRAAVDVPAKIRREPLKAAAIAGGAGFLVLGGPRRLFRRAKRAVTGPPEPFPESMLPEQVEKTLRQLGDDGAAVRGALERDFAAYAKQASRDRARLRTLLVLTVARPLLSAGTKAAAGWLFRTDDEGFQARLAQIRERTERQSKGGGGDGPKADSAADGRRRRSLIRAGPGLRRLRRSDRGFGGTAERGSLARPGPARRSRRGRRERRARLRPGEWRNGRRAGLRSRCRVSGVEVRSLSRLPVRRSALGSLRGGGGLAGCVHTARWVCAGSQHVGLASQLLAEAMLLPPAKMTVLETD